jgi:hypothetical protein
LGTFDFVTLNAVYEHLLPDERTLLLPQLWASLRYDGVLFVNQTPYRWYVLEHHTTALPFTNYLPESLALRYARRFAGWKRHRVAPDADWETLLRGGIRGATEGQIVRRLAAIGNGMPLPLRPRLWGYSDAIDLWYAQSMIRRPMWIKPVMRAMYKAIGRVTGSPFAPDVTLAIRKASHASTSTVRGPHTRDLWKAGSSVAVEASDRKASSPMSSPKGIWQAPCRWHLDDRPGRPPARISLS